MGCNCSQKTTMNFPLDLQYTFAKLQRQFKFDPLICDRMEQQLTRLLASHPLAEIHYEYLGKVSPKYRLKNARDAHQVMLECVLAVILYGHRRMDEYPHLHLRVRRWW